MVVTKVSQREVAVLLERLAAHGPIDVEVVRGGDLDTYLETAHPDCEWYPFTAQSEGGEATVATRVSAAGGPTWESNLESSRRASTSVGTWATP